MPEKIATMLPVDDVAAAVAAWTQVLGTPPTFVDGDRWAQFDVNGSRLALAGKDRIGAGAGIMAKVADLEERRDRLTAAGLAPGGIEQGPHERRFSVEMPGGGLAVFYSAS